MRTKEKPGNKDGHSPLPCTLSLCHGHASLQDLWNTEPESSGLPPWLLSFLRLRTSLAQMPWLIGRTCCCVGPASLSLECCVSLDCHSWPSPKTGLHPALVPTPMFWNAWKGHWLGKSQVPVLERDCPRHPLPGPFSQEERLNTEPDPASGRKTRRRCQSAVPVSCQHGADLLVFLMLTKSLDLLSFTNGKA